jgi:hypothetical protein
VTDIGTQQIRRKPILNGLINEYTHAAWRTEDLQVTQPNPIFERDRPRAARQAHRPAPAGEALAHRLGVGGCARRAGPGRVDRNTRRPCLERLTRADYAGEARGPLTPPLAPWPVPHRPAARRPARQVLMTLGMCRDPLHRPPASRGARPPPTSPARQKSAEHLHMAAYASAKPHRKALVNSAIHVGKGELSLGYG